MMSALETKQTPRCTALLSGACHLFLVIVTFIAVVDSNSSFFLKKKKKQNKIVGVSLRLAGGREQCVLEEQ